ncbi:MAG: ATP-binding protein, partial [Candidatus Margulisbacteria bacterium]|nr:ATP-binding protein [Candidatus Margulisiibacteriota bacterium]
LINGVKQINSRKFGTKINIKRNDEIGELIEAFNSMSEKLAEVDKVKADFLSVISHELYTPLTPIRGGAEALKNAAGLTEEIKQIVSMIDRQAIRMQTLVDEIFDFSWAETKEGKLSKEPLSLNSLVNDVIDELQPAIEKRGLEMKVELGPDLPTIMADGKRVRHVIKILLGNAVKFSAEKGQITVKTIKTATGIEFSVEDSGIGIALKNLEKIFDGFYQTEDPLTRAHGGVGLGLAIAKRIVEAHQGGIRAESAGLGRGSRFSFFLPIK